MSFTVVSVSSSNLTSGVGADGFSDANALTLVGVGLGCLTAGGAAFVAAAVAPGYTLGGAAVTAACLVGGHYLPVTDDSSDETVTSVTETD